VPVSVGEVHDFPPVSVFSTCSRVTLVVFQAHLDEALHNVARDTSYRN